METNFGWTAEALKSMLTDLQPSRTDFSVEIAGVAWKKSPNGGYKLGDYCERTHRLRILANRCSSAKEVLEVTIHEYAHHLMWEAFHFGEFKRRVVHGKPFWDCYFKLLRDARFKGVFDVENTDEDHRIKDITEAWFITDPVLIMGMLSHELKTNSAITSFRCGRGVIEYNPQYAGFLTKQQLEERLKAEVIRILLQHPYRGYSDKGIAFIASNITLNEVYKFRELMHRVDDFWKGMGCHYRGENLEFYYRELKKLNFLPDTDGHADNADGNADNADNSGIEDKKDNNEKICENPSNLRHLRANFSEMQEATELWEEDDFMAQKVREIIGWAQENQCWGTLPGTLIQTLIASLKPEIDYRKVLSAFRATVISSATMLTRFKPSRRYGFEYMGKKNDFTTNLLVAVDVSSSVSNSELQKFYSTINRFFKYGIKSIDVLQFDAEVKPSLLTLQKAKKDVKIYGRGGTNFQPVIDYFEKSKVRYDGLIIFTDGFAPTPKIRYRTACRTIWIYNKKENYETHNERLAKCGRSCWIKGEG